MEPASSDQTDAVRDAHQANMRGGSDSTVIGGQALLDRMDAQTQTLGAILEELRKATGNANTEASARGQQTGQPEAEGLAREESAAKLDLLRTIWGGRVWGDKDRGWVLPYHMNR